MDSWNVDDPSNYSFDCANLDSDNDGVINEFDSCPNTPSNLTVDSYGCPMITALNLLNNPKANDGINDWISFGNSGYENYNSNSVFFTKDIIDESAYLYQDIEIRLWIYG